MSTNIEWTESTWNPLAGCTEISPGCANCYAAVMARRLTAMGQAKYTGTTKELPNGKVVWSGKVNIDSDALQIPLKKRKPTMYFVNSMSDLFHEDVPDEFIDKVFAVMALCPQHTFQVLTKRADRLAAYFGNYPEERIDEEAWEMRDKVKHWRDFAVDYIRLGRGGFVELPIPNVWIGVSVEDQQRKDRIDFLRRTPAAMRAELLASIRVDAKTAIRKAMGAALWNRFWGPELERLVGVVYEVWMERSKMETEVAALRADKELFMEVLERQYEQLKALRRQLVAACRH